MYIIRSFVNMLKIQMQRAFIQLPAFRLHFFCLQFTTIKIRTLIEKIRVNPFDLCYLRPIYANINRGRLCVS